MFWFYPELNAVNKLCSKSWMKFGLLQQFWKSLDRISESWDIILQSGLKCHKLMSNYDKISETSIIESWKMIQSWLTYKYLIDTCQFVDVSKNWK